VRIKLQKFKIELKKRKFTFLISATFFLAIFISSGIFLFNQNKSRFSGSAELSGLPQVLQASVKPWGAFYASIDQSLQYGMNGIITGSHQNARSVLDNAQRNNLQVIITLGSFAECNYYLSDRVFNYTDALSDVNSALDQLITSLGGAEGLRRYVDNGTLAALRIFDEVHYAGSCGGSRGIEYSLELCGLSGTVTSRSLRGLPIGTETQAGFADFLHQVKKRLPDNLAIGSTSAPSYMVLVAERMNILRAR